MKEQLFPLDVGTSELSGQEDRVISETPYVRLLTNPKSGRRALARSRELRRHAVHHRGEADQDDAVSRWGNHWITLLWWHFGEDMHAHSCLGPADVINAAMDAGTDTHLRDFYCDWAVIGVGHDCPGTGEPDPNRRRHWLQNLNNRVEAMSAWDDYEAAEAAA